MINNIFITKKYKNHSYLYTDLSLGSLLIYSYLDRNSIVNLSQSLAITIG